MDKDERVSFSPTADVAASVAAIEMAMLRKECVALRDSNRKLAGSLQFLIDIEPREIKTVENAIKLYREWAAILMEGCSQ